MYRSHLVCKCLFLHPYVSFVMYTSLVIQLRTSFPTVCSKSLTVSDRSDVIYIGLFIYTYTLGAHRVFSRLFEESDYEQ